jgi:hypothetical protein
VGFDGPYADVQAPTDITIHESRPNQLQYLLFPGSDRP